MLVKGLDLPSGPSGVNWLLFFFFFLDLVGLLQGQLIQPLGQHHAPGSGCVSNGQSHHIVGHEVRQLHTPKLSLQLAGQLQESIKCHFNELNASETAAATEDIYTDCKHLHEQLLLLLLGLTLSIFIYLIATGGQEVVVVVKEN